MIASMRKTGWLKPNSTRGHGGQIGQNGLKTTAGKQIPARDPKKGKLKVIEPAPGRYVKMKGD